MDITNEENNSETYRLPCSRCKKKTNYEVIIISRKYGIKLKCLGCGKMVHKNIKYLEGKKNE